MIGTRFLNVRCPVPDCGGPIYIDEDNEMVCLLCATPYPQGRANLTNELVGVKGGPKTMWLRQNRRTVLDCLEAFGEAFVMDTFHIQAETLFRLKNEGN